MVEAIFVLINILILFSVFMLGAIFAPIVGMIFLIVAAICEFAYIVIKFADK